MCKERILRVRWALLVVLVGALSGLVTSTARTPVPATPRGIRRLLDAPRDQKGTMMQALAFDYRMTDASFAQREQTYFLLTPALLLQEAVSGDVVLTYPEE
jgi:hypothetical protein